MEDSQTKIMIIESSFNIWPMKKERLSSDWIENRIKIFMGYTLKSLKAQTNQNFLALIKYDSRSKNIIENELKKYEKLPENIKFVTSEEFAEIVSEKTKNHDLLYMIRLDCDDMYRKTFIQQLYDINPSKETKVIINQNGYIYDSVKNRIAKFFYTSPNYYTLIYDVDKYLDGERYALPGGHDYAIKLPHEIISKRNYIRHAHTHNTVTCFERYGIKDKDIIKDEKIINDILKDFME
ncbi:MAG: Rhamnosyl transferase [Sporanaerobacter sp.]|jgi:hypothetical protein|uniref:glycosyltransferase n=1 Tax=Sporanaerobacter sp. TaxID=2010183 RepID=UPI003A10210A